MLRQPIQPIALRFQHYMSPSLEGSSGRRTFMPFIMASIILLKESWEKSNKLTLPFFWRYATEWVCDGIQNYYKLEQSHLVQRIWNSCGSRRRGGVWRASRILRIGLVGYLQYCVKDPVNSRFEVDYSGLIIKLPISSVPWKDHLSNLEKSLDIEENPIQYVIFPNQKGMWRVQCVPI